MKNNTSTYQHTKLTMDQNINPMEAGFSIFAERQIRHLRSFRTPNQNGGWLQQYYITNNITSPEVYIDMIQEIRMANPNDSIFIYINSEGGEVDTGIQIINAIQYRDWETDRKSTRLNSSHSAKSRMPSSA